MKRPTVRLPSRKQMLAAKMTYEVERNGVTIRFADPITAIRAEKGEWQLGADEWQAGYFVGDWPS